MPKILVTGANGFVGLHLAKDLSSNGYSVIGIGGAQGSKDQQSYFESYMELDLTKDDEVAKIDFSDIDSVIHLAGLAAVGPSFDNPLLYINVNIGIEINLYETALKQGAKPKFLIISSGTLYDSKASLPLTEATKVNPNSPYAVSKIGQENTAIYYQARGFESLIARPFNHIGPGQGLGFIAPDLAQQIVDFEKGKNKEVVVGNLGSKRDYTDVRDIVRAYRLLLEKGHPGEIYNVCSGKALSGHEILEGLLSSVDKKPEIKQDLDKMRPSDTPVVYGSHSKLTKDTGWQPEIPIETTFADIISYWREKN